MGNTALALFTDLMDSMLELFDGLSNLSAPPEPGTQTKPPSFLVKDKAEEFVGGILSMCRSASRRGDFLVVKKYRKASSAHIQAFSI